MQKILILLPMYSLLKYSDNYSMTSENLWNYYRDDLNDDVNENNSAGNDRINNSKTTTSKSFEYKTEITRKTAILDRLNTGVVVPLKYLSNFWRSLDLSLINCEIELACHTEKIVKFLKYQEHLQLLPIHPIHQEKQHKQLEQHLK